MRIGINRFLRKTPLEKHSFASRGDCIFISHSSLDKPAAREASKFILELGIDVYFDEYDEELQRADQKGNDQEVVACLERGIANSTRLLGIITENTKKSWWVPYEIGSATGHGKEHAHLISKEVKALPSYIKASTIIPALDGLRKWLPYQAAPSSTEYFLERLERLTNFTKAASVSNFSYARQIDELTFY